MVAWLQYHKNLDHAAANLVYKKIAQSSTKVVPCSNRVAQYSTKVGIKNPSKHTHVRSSFKNLVAGIPAVKTDLNSEKQFKRYDFLKI